MPVTGRFILGGHNDNLTFLSSPGSTTEYSAFIQIYFVAGDTLSVTFSECSFSQQNFLKDLLEKANKTVDDTKLAEYTDLMVRAN